MGEPKSLKLKIDVDTKDFDELKNKLLEVEEIQNRINSKGIKIKLEREVKSEKEFNIGDIVIFESKEYRITGEFEDGRLGIRWLEDDSYGRKVPPKYLKHKPSTVTEILKDFKNRIEKLERGIDYKELVKHINKAFTEPLT